jgi:hypothetical protein
LHFDGWRIPQWLEGKPLPGVKALEETA